MPCSGETDSTEPLSSQTLSRIEKERDNVNLSSAKIKFIRSQTTKAIALPAEDISPFLQEPLSPDVLFCEDTMTDRGLFYASRKLLESVCLAFDRTPGTPMPNKLSDALYRNFGNILQTSKAVLMTYKQSGTIHSVLRHYNNNSEPYSHESTQNQSQPSTRLSPVEEDPKIIFHESSSRERTPCQSLAKNRQAAANGFNRRHQKFFDSQCSVLPLLMVKRRFFEVVYEQDNPANDQVQLF